MSEQGYVLTEAAQTDLRGIIRDTRKKWGDTQVRRYTAALEKGIAPPCGRAGGLHARE